jgi:uncharacterized protein (TIGR03435 family)
VAGAVELRRWVVGGRGWVACMRAIIPVACCLASVTSVFAQATAPRVEFEAASIKRNLLGSRPWLARPAGGRFTATNVPLKLLIGLGWPQRIAGGPPWVFTDGYDITAKEPERSVNDAEFSLLMQNLLKDRFGLRVHTESHAARVYVLTPAKNGLKLPDAKPEPCFSGSKTPHADAQDECGGMKESFDGVVHGRSGRSAW